MSHERDTDFGGTKTISALFDTRADATDAVSRLHDAGISNAKVRLVEGSGEETAGEPVARHKGFWESLGDFFFPDEDRYAYAEGLARGGYLVTVQGLIAGQYEAALDILDDAGTVDLDDREAGWRSEGWTGYETSPYAGRAVKAAASAATTGVAIAGRADAEHHALPDGIRLDEPDRSIDQPIPSATRDTAIDRRRIRSYSIDRSAVDKISGE